MENCRLLMRICSNALFTCDVLMVHLVPSEVPPPYIYGDELLKPMKLSLDSSSDKQSLLSPIVISFPTCVYRSTKVEKLWKEAFRRLYSYLSLVDIVCLKTTSVLTYQMP